MSALVKSCDAVGGGGRVTCDDLQVLGVLVRCKKHHTYKGVRAPQVNCHACRVIYNYRVGAKRPIFCPHGYDIHKQPCGQCLLDYYLM